MCVCASSTPLIQGLDIFLVFLAAHLIPNRSGGRAPSYEAVRGSITFLALCETWKWLPERLHSERFRAKDTTRGHYRCHYLRVMNARVHDEKMQTDG